MKKISNHNSVLTPSIKDTRTGKRVVKGFGRSIQYGWVLALALFASPAFAQLFVGTSLNAVGGSNDAFEVNVTTSAATSLFSRPVWGATFDIANNRVLFTSEGVIGGDELFEYIPGAAAPVSLGTITDAAGGPFRIDGLAISGGTLYGSRAAGVLDGIYSIDMGTLVATLEFALTDSISGLDANPVNGAIYGVNDTTGFLVEIDVGAATVTPVVAYPASEDDIDGLAVSPDGKAYLIPDDDAPGEFFVYNLITDAYEASLTAPWVGADTFSGGAYMEALPTAPIPTLSRTGSLLLILMIAAMIGFRFRNKGFHA